MGDINMYHAGSRELQERFGTTTLADRLVDNLAHKEFTDADTEFIESRTFFFLSTADDQGHLDCSYKGGDEGFARVIDDRTLAFPSYDGNGMFKSLGNIVVNPNVGLLFIDFERPKRLRVNGRASVSFDTDLVATFDGAQAVVLVEPEAIFPNCPRYIHRSRTEEKSVFVPRAGYTPPIPEWKQRPMFNEVLPVDDPAKK